MIDQNILLQIQNGTISTGRAKELMEKDLEFQSHFNPLTFNFTQPKVHKSIWKAIKKPLPKDLANKPIHFVSCCSRAYRRGLYMGVFLGISGTLIGILIYLLTK